MVSSISGNDRFITISIISKAKGVMPDQPFTDSIKDNRSFFINLLSNLVETKYNRIIKEVHDISLVQFDLTFGSTTSVKKPVMYCNVMFNHAPQFKDLKIEKLISSAYDLLIDNDRYVKIDATVNNAYGFIFAAGKGSD